MAKFQAAGIQPFGVNPAGVEAHASYVKKLRFNFPLLSDPDLGVARGFGRAGAQLVIADVNATGLADRAKEFAAEGFAVHAEAGDLTTPDAARRAVAGARERFGGLDVVVNVAGGLVSYGPVLDL